MKYTRIKAHMRKINNNGTSKRDKPLIQINESLLIAKGTKTTKICSWCGGRIVQGLYHAVIRDSHRVDGTGKLYHSNRIYIHTECFKPFSEKILSTIKKQQERINKNKAEIILEKI